MEKKELLLQPRLSCIASLVRRGASVADIGTDHGYLPVWLLQRGVIPRAIASDINALPLEHAKRTAAAYGITEGIDFRLCAGLDAIGSAEADTIIIAGMGGETIIEILKNAPWTREKTLLLQPMTKIELLRTWLAENGYVITAEQLVRDKEVLYAVITAAGGESAPLSPAQAYCGVKLQHDPLWGDCLEERIGKLARAVQGLKLSGRPDREDRAAKLQAIIEELKRYQKEWYDGNRQNDREESV